MSLHATFLTVSESHLQHLPLALGPTMRPLPVCPLPIPRAQGPRRRLSSSNTIAHSERKARTGNARANRINTGVEPVGRENERGSLRL